ncbi:MAG: hypothetical protein V1706_14615 [Pseudomonadota bacterium]
MECERLNRLVRSWYVQVQEESLAPARMVEFMEKHLLGCMTCLGDPDVRSEVKKITEIVLPPSKMIKPILEGDDDEYEEEDVSVVSSSDEDGDEEGEDVQSVDDIVDDEDEFEADDDDPDFDPTLEDDDDI